jgi:hypothetical protein
VSNADRPILTLKSAAPGDPTDDRPLELGVYDLLLRCRHFAIDHKVAEVGRVSLTAEFVLRLLKSVDGMSEDDVAAFFGFDRRDMSFVLTEVETQGYVSRQDGRLWLTTIGHAVFRDRSTHPEIFEVERRRETIGFDLVALAPEDRRFLDDFERRLPELKLIDPEKASSAMHRIPDAFRKFYTEIISRREPSATPKRSLYSIDNVVAQERFSSTVRISVCSTGLRPSIAEPDLSGWRPEYEREDRSLIIEAASRFVEELKVSRRADDRDAYQVLIDLAPEFLKDFKRRDGLSVERYYREALARAGDVRADRPTVPVLGSLFTRENTRRLFDTADYGMRAVLEPSTLCVWIAPQTPFWGATNSLPAILAQIKTRILAPAASAPGEVENATIGLIAGKAAKHVEMAFDNIGTCDTPSFPSALEILLAPRVLIAAIVNAPIGLPNGAAVPLGFISFDERVVARAQAYVVDRIASFSISDEMCGKIRTAMSNSILQADSDVGPA